MGWEHLVSKSYTWLVNREWFGLERNLIKAHPLLTLGHACFPVAVFVTQHQGRKTRAAVLSKAREGLYMLGNICFSPEFAG